MQQVTVKPHIFDDRDALKFEIIEGATIEGFIKQANLPVAIRNHIRADINGVPVPVDDFEKPLSKDDLVTIYVVPLGGGGKSILRLVAMIAVVVTAGVLAPIAGGVLGITSAGGIAGLTAGFSALGMLAVNALIPPPSISTGDYNSTAPATSYTITGQSNSMSPYGVIPRLYGTHRFYPRLCVKPLVWNISDKSYMKAIYDFGYGELELYDVRLGNTSIDNYTTHTNFLPYTKGGGLRYYTKKSTTENIGLELKAGNTIVRETALDTNYAELEISLPSGLVKIKDNGDYEKTFVEFEVSYRKAGTNNALSNDNITAYGKGLQLVGDPKSIEIEYNYIKRYYNGQKVYALDGSATTVKINTSIPLEKGSRIYNLPLDQRTSWNVSNTEYRTITADVPAGNGVTVHIDRPFTNCYRTNYGETVPTYFSSSVLPKTNKIRIGNNTADANTILVRAEFGTADQYEIHIKRITADSDDNQLINKSYWGLFRSFERDTPLDLDTEHSLLELALTANEQINGVVENINALCKSKLKTWNGASFETKTTNNPAWIVLDILTGSANDGSISINQIDLASFKAFADYCDELVYQQITATEGYWDKRHTCNAVITSLTTVNDLVQSILSQSRASLKISSNGKYGILYDIAKTQPVQLFTSRNSSDFSSDRSYADLPHAVKVKYINESQNYEMDEVIVYADGYSYATATKFETIETFGITNYHEAWRHGRYTLAQMISYQETFTITVDLEHLSVQRGELVSVQHDVPKIGGLPLRVKEVLDGGLTIVLNDALATDGVSEYHYLVRADDLTIETGVISGLVDAHTVTLAVANPNIKPNDVFVYGYKDYVTKDYLVSGITPSADLKATLSLIPYDPAVYTADTGTMPYYTSGIAPALVNECEVGITDLALDYSIIFENRMPIPKFNLSWQVTSTAVLKKYLVEWASNGLTGDQYLVAGYTEDTNFSFMLGNLVDNKHLIGNDIYFRVTPISVTDYKCIPSSEVSVTITPDETVPADVEFFNCNIVNETLNLTWKANKDPDIASYIIKYHESTDRSIATWERSVVLTDRINFDTLRHTTNARKGTYLIKALDTSDNISRMAKSAVTSIPDIVNLNVVEVLDDSTAWLGEKDNLIVENALLKTDILTTVPTTTCTIQDGLWRDSKIWCDSITWLDVPYDYTGTQYVNNGRYTFNDMVDLGDIYTPRITTALDAFATIPKELIYTWVKLSDIETLGDITYSLWNAYIAVRMASYLGGISNWALLSNVSAMADDAGSDWTEEALSEVGDFTGRYFRFYLVVETQSNKIRVNIDQAKVNVDMPDRIISGTDLISGVINYRVTFDKPFYVTPSIGITQDNASKGDRYVITNKDKTGFNIEFFDINDNTVSRQFDYMAKAYGKISSTLI